ncbi:marine proteobacterial sortase target protein [Microbulbifer yueqingensis]|uniref:Ca-activated chloride channel family protein n=1 Tax=Microbulbifer yueqingensis TaxID=658219 RepID=A0A1G8VSP3_9GAMM|nr:marine proteobacterial sortase target protein [Microbulbifer yueqingensis]SDJ68989.1 Ca-activated chloride channel family protein [Microbulbifer yueqingensis]
MDRTIFSGQRIPRELVVLPTEEYYRRRYRNDRRGRWLLLLVTALAVVVAAAGARAAGPERVPAGAVSPDQVGSGDLLFRAAGQANYRPAVHLNSRATVRVRGLLAEVELEQVFENASPDWREAVYVVPLPPQAAVNGLEIRVGERRIVGRVRERQQAARIYREARAAGKRAALLEQQRPNLFTSRVANIGPGEKVTAKIRFLAPVAYEGGAFSLRLPTSLTPRYMPGEPIEPAGEARAIKLDGNGWALPTDQVPDAHQISPFMQPAPELTALDSHRIAVSVELDGGLPLADISSPYHDIDSSRLSGGDYRITLRGGTALMDRDFVLRWRPRPSAMPRAALFAEVLEAKAGGADQEEGDDRNADLSGTYLQLLLLPPDTAGGTRRLPREVVFVIDTSGSMGGSSIRQARDGLLLALARLQPDDRFNIIEFNSVTRAFFPRPVPARAENLHLARAQVEALRATGGTEMAPALRKAFSQQLPGDETLVRQVVFITDGAVGNESALFELIRQSLGDARLFTVGIGSAPNRHFMRKAAQFGRGASVTIGDVGEVGAQMQALFSKLENPLVTDLRVTWPRGLHVDAYPKKIPDLYRGEPLRLVARVRGADVTGKLRVSGRLAGRQFHRELELGGKDGSGGLGSLWARRRIEALRDRQRPVGEQSAAGQQLRTQILGLALAFQLASPYTSFVAVEEKPVRPVGEALASSAVPNAVARGQVLQQQAYPATATGLYGQLLLGLALLGLGGLLRRGRGWRGTVNRQLRRWLRRWLPDPRRAPSGRARGELERLLVRVN